MKIIPFISDRFNLDGGAMFGVVPKVMWKKYFIPDDNNYIRWVCRCLLILDKHHNILIDTGMGNKLDNKFIQHFSSEHFSITNTLLQQHNIKSSDITDVILTHLHFDHCGGATTLDTSGNLKTSFPNANYWVSHNQWNWANNPNEREKASFIPDNFIPIMSAGQLNFVEDVKYKLPTTIKFEYCFGHTESMICPIIEYKGTKIAFLADLLPSHAHLSLPFIMSYDIRPLDTLKDKKRIFDKAIDENWIIVFDHDPLYDWCQITKNHNGQFIISNKGIWAELNC